MGKNKKKRSQQRRQQQQLQQQQLILLAQRPQQTQQMEQLLNEGVSLNNDKKKQEAAEKFLEAVYRAPSVWMTERFSAFVYAMTVAEEIEQDSGLISAAYDFLNNEEEPAHFRAHAALSAARRCFYGCLKYRNMNGTAEFSRHGLDIINKSPEEDGDRKFLIAAAAKAFPRFQDLLGPGDCDSTTLKKILEQLREQLGHLLQLSERRFSRNADFGLLFERFSAGGKMCDCCEKTPEELGLTFLKLCKCCEMVNYCSEKCQSKDWKKGGHKHTCREPGQIEVGDNMLMRYDEGFGRFVEVIDRVEEGETNHWQVKLIKSDEICSANGDQLVRLRPPRKPSSSAPCSVVPKDDDDALLLNGRPG